MRYYGAMPTVHSALPSVSPQAVYARRHLRVGWWSIAIFAAMGLALETLHGFKVRTYLDVSNETRRLVWTLAHAHGTLVGAINVLFGLTLARAPHQDQGLRATSILLIAAGVLLPAGFFLGGVVFYSGDPGLGILLVPAGAIALIAALVRIAHASGRVS